jgi:hypothetical protein
MGVWDFPRDCKQRNQRKLYEIYERFGRVIALSILFRNFIQRYKLRGTHGSPTGFPWANQETWSRGIDGTNFLLVPWGMSMSSNDSEAGSGMNLLYYHLWTLGTQGKP